MINLVTGGAGFIGSNLIESLLKKDEIVICLDNLETGSKENIKKWLDNKNFKFIFHDVNKPINLKVDRIWHLACPASPNYYLKNPLKTAKTNFIGTLNMLNLAKKLKIKILFASTSEIYGDPLEHPQDENYKGNVNPNGVRSCYEEGKRMAESLCFDYSRKFNTEICIARIFNTYGPNMKYNDGRVISNFINQALKNKPITIYGDGLQTRSFCYVDDLIFGLINLMNINFNGPVNIGDDKEISIIELSEMIKKKIKTSSPIIKTKMLEDEPKIRRPNLELLRDLIEWEPSTNLNEGLDKTIQYFLKAT